MLACAHSLGLLILPASTSPFTYVMAYPLRNTLVLLLRLASRVRVPTTPPMLRRSPVATVRLRFRCPRRLLRARRDARVTPAQVRVCASSLLLSLVQPLSLHLHD